MPRAAQSLPGPLVSRRGCFTGTAGLHDSKTDYRFNGADEDGFGCARWKANNVEAPMIAVDEINIGMAGRTPHDAVAGGRAVESVARGIVGQISLGFDDDTAAETLWGVTQQKMPEQTRGDRFGGRQVKGAREDGELGRPFRILAGGIRGGRLCTRQASSQRGLVKRKPHRQMPASGRLQPDFESPSLK